MVLKQGNIGKWITNTLKELKCGFGEGWRRPLDPSCEKLRSITHSQQKKKYPTYI